MSYSQEYEMYGGNRGLQLTASQLDLKFDT